VSKTQPLRPLHGRRIVITRPREKAAEFAAELEALGAKPVILPTIETIAPEDTSGLDHALHNLIVYDWLVFTSANAVHFTFDRIYELKIDVSNLLDEERFEPGGMLQVACIGPATSAALREYYSGMVMHPDESIAEGLFNALYDSENGLLRGVRILMPQANIAEPTLYDLLTSEDAVVDNPVAYQTVSASPEATEFEGPFDAVTFTSGSTARNFAAMFEDPYAVVGDARIVCIGPKTARVVHELGWAIHAIAEPHTMEGMLDALVKLFANEES